MISENTNQSPDLVTLLFVSSLWFHFTGNELGAKATINAALDMHYQYKWLNSILDEVDSYC